MGHNRPGRGDDFLEGRISEENLETAQHMPEVHHGDCNLPITLICQPTVGTVGNWRVGVGCCWIIIATTNCTTTRPNGATCCWRLLATTDCTDTRNGAACCWQFLGTTDCTNRCDEG